MAVSLAKALHAQGQTAEVISADSRQIYREIPIFSAAASSREQDGVVHHLVGSETLEQERTAGWFASRAEELIGDIHARGGVPIVAGGSGFWVQGLLTGSDYPTVAVDMALRAKLEQQSTEQLYQQLHNLDERRAGDIDPQNRRRLIRAIEIATALGMVPEQSLSWRDDWDIHVVYLSYPRDTIRTNIARGVEARFRRGLVAEAERVYEVLTPERFRELGLAYKYIEPYWRGELGMDELIHKTITEERRYAKRQRTFFDKMLGGTATACVVRLAEASQRSHVVGKLAKTLETYRETLHKLHKTER